MLLSSDRNTNNGVRNMPNDRYTKTFSGCIVAPDGVERWFINGAYGREGDHPSVIHPDGTQLFYVENPKRGGFGQFNSILHRVGGPAIIRANGDRFWYQMGKLHRPENEGPAVELLSEGVVKYVENDKFLRLERNVVVRPAHSMRP